MRTLPDIGNVFTISGFVRGDDEESPGFLFPRANALEVLKEVDRLLVPYRLEIILADTPETPSNVIFKIGERK